MKRGGPIKRRTPLRARRAIRRAPAHDADAADAFREAVIERAHGRCEVCPRLYDSGIRSAIDVARDCDGRATEAHHMEPRGMGGHGDNDPVNGVAACARAHRWLESNRRDAEALNLIRRHGKPRKRVTGS